MGYTDRMLAPALQRMADRPIAKVLDTLSRRWSIPVIYAVAEGRCRFNDLHRHLEGINHKVLIETVYRLQRDGYLDGPLTAPGGRGRTEAPPYALTGLGWQLWGLIEDIDKWSKEREQYLVRAPAEFDRPAR